MLQSTVLLTDKFLIVLSQHEVIKCASSEELGRVNPRSRRLIDIPDSNFAKLESHLRQLDLEK